MKNLFNWLLWAAVGLMGILFMAVIVAVAAFAPAVIPWAIYNYLLVPAFHWPPAHFLLVWGIVFLLGFVGTHFSRR